MIDLTKLQVWFVTGSQHLYGEEVLKTVAEHSRSICEQLSSSAAIPVEIIYKPVLTTPDAVSRLCIEANSSSECVGLITWMHTFSPAKMWIYGLKQLTKPFSHLHTQYNREIPWADIDMDFMNLNQSAHGGREFGFIGSRMHKNRKVIVGFWRDADVQEELGTWIRAACAWHDSQEGKIARFGDNMREVAVTEGDKVEAQIRFGYSVNGYAMGDLTRHVRDADDALVDNLLTQFDDTYTVAKSLTKDGDRRGELREAARIELGLRAFLEEGGFTAFTTTFENLYGLKQLPGLAVQRLMSDGYGFGAEGDWKTAALVRSMKVMASGLSGGTSFMEDYTYHLAPGGMKVLGAHMLEVCSSIADGKPSLEIHPLSIGGKEDPVRLVFNTLSGHAINATIIDLGDRFRMLANEVEVIPPEQPLPNLPVANVVWAPKPDLKTAAAAWILGGGAHHAGFSHAVTRKHLEDFAEMADIEILLIDNQTQVSGFKKELRWNEAYYRMMRF